MPLVNSRIHCGPGNCPGSFGRALHGGLANLHAACPFEAELVRTFEQPLLVADHPGRSSEEDLLPSMLTLTSPTLAKAIGTSVTTLPWVLLPDCLTLSSRHREASASAAPQSNPMVLVLRSLSLEGTRRAPPSRAHLQTLICALRARGTRTLCTTNDWMNCALGSRHACTRHHPLFRNRLS